MTELRTPASSLSDTYHFLSVSSNSLQMKKQNTKNKAFEY